MQATHERGKHKAKSRVSLEQSSEERDVTEAFLELGLEGLFTPFPLFMIFILFFFSFFILVRPPLAVVEHRHFVWLWRNSA